MLLSLTLVFDLLTSWSVDAEDLPWAVQRPTSVLIAPSIFVFRARTRRTDRQTNRQMQLNAAILLAWDNKVTEKINLTVSALAVVFHVTAVEKNDINNGTVKLYVLLAVCCIVLLCVYFVGDLSLVWLSSIHFLDQDGYQYRPCHRCC